MQLSLDQAPPGVSDSSWTTSLPGGPDIGDLWLLSWDVEALGLAIITGVAPSFVLAWPVTLASEPAFKPALTVKDSSLGEIAVWPTRETGIGNHLLHRRLGSQVLSERLMAHIAKGVENGNDLPLPFANSDLEPAKRHEVSDDMVDHWARINAHTWPPVLPGRSPLSGEALRSLGISPSRLAATLNVSLPEAAALFGERHIPSAELVENLCRELNVAPEDILVHEPSEENLHLIAPEIKGKILAIRERLGVDESDARSKLAQQYALAARSDGTAESRTKRAVHALLADHDD